MHSFPHAHERTLTTAAMTLAMGTLAVALAASASAHVRVNSTDARQDGYGKVTVRVPNESETAGTTKVSVSMPADSPLASVRVKPHAGWTITAPKVALPKPVKQGDTTLTEAVSTITWTANKGMSIKPGEFEEFDFSAGKLPKDKTSMVFPAIQTYSDGKVVRWIEQAAPGAAEPAHPSPVLDLLPAEGKVSAAVVAPPAKTGGTDSMARSLSAGAAILAVGGVGLGLRRRRAVTQ
jgi:uncharacterized protein YcnI